MKHILAILALVAFTQQAQAQTRMEQAQTSIEKSPSFRTVPVIPWNYIPNAVPSDRPAVPAPPLIAPNDPQGPASAR